MRTRRPRFGAAGTPVGRSQETEDCPRCRRGSVRVKSVPVAGVGLTTQRECYSCGWQDGDDPTVCPHMGKALGEPEAHGRRTTAWCHTCRLTVVLRRGSYLSEDLGDDSADPNQLSAFAPGVL